MTHPHALPPLKVSQKARDAAVALIRKVDHRTEYLPEIEDGSYDDNFFVQAFAAFERDLTAPSGEGEEYPGEWCQQCRGYGCMNPAHQVPGSAVGVSRGDIYSALEPYSHQPSQATDAVMALIASTATKLAEVERELHEETELRKMAEHACDTANLRLADAVGALERIGSAQVAFNAHPVGVIETMREWANNCLSKIKGTPDAE